MQKQPTKGEKVSANHVSIGDIKKLKKKKNK